nr:probable CDP-diacylglycerol--inositol 3-phosphatidyltransferase 2 isoform X3 [Ipomoea trifida]
MAKTSRLTPTTVYLYIPNIIGYMRILMNCCAFAICFKDKMLFSILYFISFVCDALDGWFARKFNQVSTFGAVLDMVTDRFASMKPCNHLFLPVLYILLFLLAENQTENLTDVLINSAKESWLYFSLLSLLLFGWATKQLVNFIQMKTAADACVHYDIARKQ